MQQNVNPIKFICAFSLHSEVKIKPEHVQESNGTNLNFEPVTPGMARKAAEPPTVEVTKSKKDR